ncbi:MAG: PAS domain S-box protein [Candidatus Rokubacteria bacterium]|nr:PAS domain S-box protein [Candidatus Rokubacteria bacterium]
MKLRAHLLILTVGTLVPMIDFAVVASAFLARRDQATFQRGAMERTFALLAAVDAELKSSIATLEALAASRHLDTDDLRAFHADATLVHASQRDWLTIILALPSAQPVVNVLFPFGTTLPPTLERRSFDEVSRTGRAVIGHLARGAITERGVVTQVDAFPIRVPVVRGGTTRYVLSAMVRPRVVAALLAAQRIPSDWIGVVVDGNARIVARTVDPERSVGQPASETLQAALARSPEGVSRGTTREGADVYTAYHRSAFSGWSVAVGIPATTVQAGARQTIGVMVFGVLGAGILAFVLAHVLGRRISAPIAALASAATILGRGERPEISRRSNVTEVRDLARALDEAAAAVSFHQAKLERRVEERTAALDDANQRLIIELAQRKETLETLRETSELLERLVEGAPDGIVVVDRTGRIARVNTQAEAMFGWPRAELLGQRIEILIPESAREKHVGERTAFFRAPRLRTMAQGIDLTGRRRDGTEFPAEIVLSPVETGDGLLVIAIVRDVSERKRVEHILSAQTERLRDAEKMEAVGRLAGGIAHDFNNLLTVIIGRTQMVLNRPLPDEIRRYVDLIHRTARRAEDLVRQLLAVRVGATPRHRAGRPRADRASGDEPRRQCARRDAPGRRARRRDRGRRTDR